MPYIVQAEADPRGELVTISAETRIDALKLAVDFLDQGRKTVTINGDARVYTPTEFAMTIGRPQ